MQFFQTRYTLHMQEIDDYGATLNIRIHNKPKDNVGRGYCVHGDIAHEFQTSRPCKPEDNIVQYLGKIATLLKQNNSHIAPRIPMLPNKVTLEFIENEITNINFVNDEVALHHGSVGFDEDGAMVQVVFGAFGESVATELTALAEEVIAPRHLCVQAVCEEGVLDDRELFPYVVVVFVGNE